MAIIKDRQLQLCLAAWGQVRKKGGSDADAQAYVKKLYANVPVLAKGGRDATNVFLQRNIGDVLITFESEVISVDREFGEGKVARVDVDFFSGPKPVGIHREASEALNTDKELFGASRVERWFRK